MGFLRTLYIECGVILSNYNQIKTVALDQLTFVGFPDHTMASPSAERASFATTARLLSCLVTESLVRAISIPLQWSDGVGIGVVLNPHVSSIPATDCISYSQGDILAIIVFKHVPVFKHDSSDPRGKEIGLLDPLDMYPSVLVTNSQKDSDENVEVLLCKISHIDSH